MAEKDIDNFADAMEDDESIEFSPNAVAKEIHDDVNQAMAIHFTRLESEVNNLFNQRMATIENNLTSKLSERVTTAQEDILKTNKIFREISRPLGTNWSNLYEILTADLPKDKVQQEIHNIKKQNSFMQPYKSLMSWKDLKGPSFNINDLVPALKSMGLNDLLEIVEKILHHDTKDDLFSLSNAKKDTEDIKGKPNKPSPNASNGKTKEFKAGFTANVDCKNTMQEAPLSKTTPQESLDDRHLLLLARKLTTNWKTLALLLAVDENDIADLEASDDSTGYQSAFKMLWNWREARGGVVEAEGSLKTLTAALNKLGLSHLIDS